VKFKVISLGCPKNLVESEYVTARLEDHGHTLSEDGDTVIINTCAFIADAARESIETALAEANPGRTVVVTGCLVERYGSKLEELLPEVNLFVGRNFYDRIETVIDKKGTFVETGRFSETFPRRVLTTPPSAYLKIQEGCDNRCSYCAVPSIRGGLQSRSPEAVREELLWLVEQGFREITVVGQDITSYGSHEGSSLVELLGYLLGVPGDYFLRLLYMHPKE
jgi:2-methylthioadenine synthetase